MSTYGTPEEFVNPVALIIVMLFGAAAWVVATHWLAHQVNCN